jgi:hypothetical protein
MSDKKIPGIHNYCDRWCERCSLGSRCAVYEGESDLTPEEKDIKNKAFWDRLSDNFAKAHAMLERAAMEHGVDLHTVTRDSLAYEEKEERNRKESESHPIAKLSMEYLTLSQEWSEAQPGMKEKLESLQQQLDLDPESFKDVKIATGNIQDCLAVIQWYQTFIHVKFMRALMGKAMNDDEDEEQRDHDGSAKIAIIAIERSMHAWMKLYELLPEQEDHFLKILALLEKVKKRALENFPLAMAFKRPGFDD